MNRYRKLAQWERVESARDTERERLAYLRQPLPPNDPQVIRPTRVRVIKPKFTIKGKPVEAGQILTMPYFDARDLVVRGMVIDIE